MKLENRTKINRINLPIVRQALNNVTKRNITSIDHTQWYIDDLLKKKREKKKKKTKQKQKQKQNKNELTKDKSVYE